MIERAQSAERLIARIVDRGIGAWHRGALLTEELLSDSPLSAVRGLPTYHEYMRFQANQVVQHLLPHERRSATAAAVPNGASHRVRGTTSSAAAAAAGGLESQQEEFSSVRPPIDASFAGASQNAPVAEWDDEDAFVEAVMKLPHLESAAAAAAADDYEPEE